MRRFAAAIFAIAMTAAVPATAADVVVTISNVAHAQGEVIAGLCTPQTFLGRNCPFKRAAPARPGSVTLVFRNVPPGVYAVQAMHDENANNDLDTSFLGIPAEGVGVSNNPPFRMRRPSFNEAAIQVSEAGAGESVRLRYFN